VFFLSILCGGSGSGLGRVGFGVESRKEKEEVDSLINEEVLIHNILCLNCKFDM